MKSETYSQEIPAEAEAEREVCAASIAEAMQVLSGKWAFQVLSELYQSKRRFNELRRRLGVSIKSLTEILRQLERQGVVAREVIPTVPVTVEYSLTDKGLGYRDVLRGMREWGEQWGERRESSPPSSVDPGPV